MKAILLAAGRGTRISKSIKEIPKSTLPIENGKSLIRSTIEKMKERNIEPVVCVGFKYENIYKELEGLDVKYFYNPFFAVTNSIASLWFAKEELNDDLIVMNADVYFSDEILDDLINNPNEVVLVSDKTRIAEGDYFFKLNEQNKVVKYGKDIPLEDRSCEYVGMAKISKSFAPSFKKRLEEMIKEEKYDAWWENVIYSYTEEKDNLISTMDISGHFWSEIDFIDDYQRILDHVNKKALGGKND